MTNFQNNDIIILRMDVEAFLEEFKRKANPKREKWAKEKTEEVVEEWNRKHTRKEILRLRYWRKKKLKEILERIEKREKGG